MSKMPGHAVPMHQEFTALRLIFKIITRAQSWFSVKRENDAVIISKAISESNNPQFPSVKINIDSRNERLKVAKELVSLATSAIDSL